MSKHLLVDMDNTICHFSSHLHKELFGLGGRGARKDAKTTAELDENGWPVVYYLSEFYEKEHEGAMKYLFSEKEFWAEIPPVPGAVDALRELQSNHKIHICTVTSGPASEQGKQQWLEKRGLGHLPVHFVKNCEEKAALCASLPSSLLIDDHPDLGNCLTGETTWLVPHRPYNADVSGECKIVRFHEWASVPDLLRFSE